MKNQEKIKREKRETRHRRVRTKVRGTNERPRLAVFKSDKHIYAQILDDEKNMTLAQVSDIKITKGKKTEKAAGVGKLIAEAALKSGIKKVSFDRGGNKYHGRIKALADAAREAGLDF